MGEGTLGTIDPLHGIFSKKELFGSSRLGRLSAESQADMHTTGR